MRKILMSVLIVAAMAALVGGATLAPFTAEETDTGTVTAGTVIIGYAGGGSILLTTGSAGCDGNIKVGDTCTGTVTITNSGTLPVTLAVAKDLLDSLACGLFASAVEGVDSVIDDASYASGSLAPAGVVVLAVSVSLPETEADEDPCQGSTASLDVTVTATQA